MKTDIFLRCVRVCDCFRVYHINLVALSSNPDYQDSPKSNTLLINSGKGAVQGNFSVDEYSSDDHDLPVKITEVTESGIHLDWSAYVENQEVAFYKIQWSSVAQPAVSECPSFFFGGVGGGLDPFLCALFVFSSSLLWYVW